MNGESIGQVARTPTPVLETVDKVVGVDEEAGLSAHADRRREQRKACGETAKAVRDSAKAVRDSHGGSRVVLI